MVRGCSERLDSSRLPLLSLQASLDVASPSAAATPLVPPAIAPSPRLLRQQRARLKQREHCWPPASRRHGSEPLAARMPVRLRLQLRRRPSVRTMSARLQQKELRLRRWRKEQTRQRQEAKEEAARALALWQRKALEEVQLLPGGKVWRQQLKARLNARTASAAARQKAMLEGRRRKAARHAQHVEDVRRRALEGSARRVAQDAS